MNVSQDSPCDGRKAVLVTGAATGIGRAVVLEFAARGWDVICHFNASRDKAEDVARLARGHGVEASLIQADLRAKAGIEGFIGRLEALNPDSLINNAGGYIDQRHYSRLTLDSLAETFTLNCFAPTLIAVRGLELMAAKGGGRIVNISSIAAKYGGSATSLDYGSSKRALEGATLTLAREGAEKGVLVNTVRPGVIATDFHAKFPKDLTRRAGLIPQGRLGEPEEVARAVYFLGSFANTYVTGQILAVSGGE